VVSAVVPYGAFVDLGGVSGLVHKSELAWRVVKEPSQVVSVGQRVTVEVLAVDAGRRLVSLSVKSTLENPWIRFARDHHLGQMAFGSVSKLVAYGAFVELDDGLTGLIHISRLARRNLDSAGEIVSVGDQVEVEILDIDPEHRRISLSLRSVCQGPP
jgi:small subunit ribosomal protein S1